MSETKINSDGSATLTITAETDSLKRSLDAAFATLTKFVGAAANELGRLDEAAAKAFGSVAASIKSASAAFAGAKGDWKGAEFPTPPSFPGASGWDDVTINVDQSLFSELLNSSVVGSLKAFGTQAAEAFVGFGDEMDKMSQRTGFAVETLSAFSHAAGQCGTDLGTVEGAIRGFQSVLADAANGSKDATEKFERIGLNVAELVDLAPEEQFRQIMRAVASVENPTLRAAAAMEIFGDAGAELGPIINGGAEALDAYLKEAEEAGVVMSGEQAASAAALSDAFGRLKSSVLGFSLSLAESLAPAARSVVDWAAETIAATREVFEENKTLVGALSAAGAAVGAAFGATYFAARLKDYGAGFATLARRALEGAAAARSTATAWNASATAFGAYAKSAFAATSATVAATAKSAALWTATKALSAATTIQAAASNALAAAKNLLAGASAKNAAASALETAKLAFQSATTFACSVATRALAAAKTILTAATLRSGAASVGAAAKLALQTAATGALTVATKGLAVASLALLANPFAWVAAAVAAIGALVYSATKAAEVVAVLKDEYKKLLEEGDRKRRAATSKFAALEKFANVGTLGEAEFAEGKRLVEELEKEYGDLGLTVDETTRTITAAADAQERLNAAIREQAKNDLQKRIEEEKGNLAEQKKVRDSLNERAEKLGGFNLETAGALSRQAGAWVTFGYVDTAEEAWTKSLEEANAGVDASEKELADLEARLAALDGGASSAALGVSAEEQAGAEGAAQDEKRKTADELDAEIAKAEKERTDRQLSETRRRINAINEETAAIVAAIDKRLEIENAKPESERDAAKIAELEEQKQAATQDAEDRVAEIEADAAAKAEEEKRRAFEDATAAEKAFTESSMSESERRIAQIEEEAAAYKKRLEAARDASTTDEERAEWQTKIDAVEAQTQAKKDEVVAEATASAPEEKEVELLEKRMRLEELLARNREGKGKAGDAEEIARLNAEIASGEDEAAKAELEKAKAALETALANLKEARDNPFATDAEIAKASEEANEAKAKYDEALEAMKARVGFGAEEGAVAQEEVFDAVDSAVGSNSAKTVSSGATFSALDAQKLGANNPAEENVKETKRTNALLAGLLDRWDESDFSLRIA